MVDAAQQHIAIGGVRIDIQGLLKRSERFVETIHLDQNPAQFTENNRRIGTSLQGPLVFAGGGFGSTLSEDLIAQVGSLAGNRRLNFFELHRLLVLSLVLLDPELSDSASLDLFQPFALEKIFPARLKDVKGHSVDLLNGFRCRFLVQSRQQLSDSSPALALINKVDGGGSLGVSQLQLLGTIEPYQGGLHVLEADKLVFFQGLNQ